MPWPEGLNFNGIVLTADQRHLVACQTNTGRYWRIAIKDGTVDEVALDGGPLPHSDGLAIDGTTLYAAVNAHDTIAVIDLSADGGSGAVRGFVRSPDFRFPTAVAVAGDGCGWSTGSSTGWAGRRTCRSRSQRFRRRRRHEGARDHAARP